MRNHLFLLGLFFFLAGSAVAAVTDWYSLPMIVVTPRTLNFGSVTNGTTVTNVLVIENAGNGRLTGTATVAAPFRVISEPDYSLKHGAAQIITISYTPAAAVSNSTVVKFTGGGGAKVPLVGMGVTPRSNLYPASVR